jgi:hypothetical protein
MVYVFALAVPPFTENQRLGSRAAARLWFIRGKDMV